MQKPLILLAIGVTAGLAVGAGLYVTGVLSFPGDGAGDADVTLAGDTDEAEATVLEQPLTSEGGRPGLRGSIPSGARAARGEAEDGSADDEAETEETEVVLEQPVGVEEPMVGNERGPTDLWPGEPTPTSGPASWTSDGRRIDPVMKALYWLKAHQSPDGGFEAAGWNRWCKDKPAEDPDPRAADLGSAQRDIGVTGLAVCAYLGAGYTNRGKHPFAKTVSKGLRYLKNVQDPEGCFGPRTSAHFLTDHALASLAMIEAYGMTGSPIFKGSAQRSLDFGASARNPESGWGSGVRTGASDTLHSGLMMFPVQSARLANKDAVGRGKKPPLVVDEEAFDGVVAWLDGVTDFESGRVGNERYGDDLWLPFELARSFHTDQGRGPEAISVLARIFAGAIPKEHEAVLLAGQQLASRPPVWDAEHGTIDALYWWLGAVATYQIGGRAWKTWRDAFKASIIETQRDDDFYCDGKGSWDPVGAWGGELGRAGTTALLTMCIEVYYRYDRVFGTR